MQLYDAHNHLHDERFEGSADELVAESGATAMVVNGSCEADWPEVEALAKKHPSIIPSFGYHPWYIASRTKNWEKKLLEFLDRTPSAVGEIGLDRWKRGLAYDGQEEVFVRQLEIAAERNLPASIHCLQTWGRMLELLQANARPERGFLLHSYGGPAEMVAPMAKLGAYFSLPGNFARKDKENKQEAFLKVPLDRLLIETDAPDQPLPPDRLPIPFRDSKGHDWNHPGNIYGVYAFAAELYDIALTTLAAQVEENFLRLFSPVTR